jgi:amidase
VETVRDALARLDAAAALGAVVDRHDDDVLRRAEAVQRAGLPWRGRPVTVKDWIDVEGFACEGESPTRSGRRPSRDATVVGRLRAAGAVVIAKTQPGAEHPLHGTCHHPHDSSRTPGGSSSGEASLIGAGASTLGIGSDSGGSIRLPAAWCGVHGFKPSFGLVPNTGHFPRVGARGDGRTVIGPLATTVADLVAALHVIAGPDGLDPSVAPVQLRPPDGVDLGELRVAIADDALGDRVAASTRDAVDRAAGSLAAAGAIVVDARPPLDLDRSTEITVGYWTRVRRTGAEAQEQLDAWDRYDRWLTRTLGGIDVVLTPVVRDVAPPRRPVTADDYVLTLPWSLTGWPAASVPSGSDPDTGLPVAVQVIAPRWHDHVVLAVARCLERAAPALA